MNKIGEIKYYIIIANSRPEDTETLVCIPQNKSTKFSKLKTSRDFVYCFQMLLQRH